MEAGDEVVCIDTGDYKTLLTLGRVYVALKTNEAGVWIMANDGQQHGFYRTKFELAKPKGSTMEDGAMEYEEAMAAQELLEER